MDADTDRILHGCRRLRRISLAIFYGKFARHFSETQKADLAVTKLATQSVLSGGSEVGKSRLRLEAVCKRAL